LKIQNICTYKIKVQNTLEPNVFNVGSPIKIELLHSEENSTLFAAQTDQPGVIGLIRYLHNQGYLILLVQRSEKS
jgi:hypothetical protein